MSKKSSLFNSGVSIGGFSLLLDTSQQRIKYAILKGGKSIQLGNAGQRLICSALNLPTEVYVWSLRESIV